MTGQAGPVTATRMVTIVNKKGLHARAAHKFVQCAGRFSADITVVRDGASVPALSIMGLLMLAAAQGSTMELRASGPDAEQALNALADLIANKFDETETVGGESE
ncbi:HPr family phosphocarrier protein [bacterium]|nr:HPr family phosphocarrier protein [bacterium]